MKTELMYLVWVSALTALMWIPYILDRLMVWGLMDTVGYPENPKPQSPWARRMKAAHANAVENLVIFAALVLAAQAASVSNGVTVMACAVYFWARLVHFLAYTFRVPWVRTLGFVVGFVAQMMLVWQILAA
ncbi:MAG TPA: MAPEG family protein [Burkholderiales bacterium]|nr:MAPEG family protein [Burkholderiales bacterium]